MVTHLNYFNYLAN